MRDDLFIQLGDKFASFSKLASSDEARLLECTMAEAGRLLFDALTKNWTTLKTLAPWLTQRPEERRFTNDRQDRIVEVLEPRWAMYWWYAIVWLWHERADTGITLPASRLRRLETRPLWCNFAAGPFVDALPRRPSQEVEAALWRDIASCSVDACQFVAREVAGDYMPAVHFTQFGIKGDGLRKAKEEGRLRAQTCADGRNLYNVKDVQRLRPECFRKMEKDLL